MGKVFWNDAWECWVRSIKINGETTIVSSMDKECLEKMPYRINNDSALHSSFHGDTQ